MKKRLKHVLISTIIFVLLITVSVPLYAFADEAKTATDTSSDVSKTDTDSTTDPLPEDEANQENKSFFDVMFSGVSENLSKILSALAFIGSLIVMLCYKKGFVPLVTEGLGAIASGVKTIGEKTGELGVGTKEFANQIDERLKSAEKLVQNAEHIFESLDVKLAELDKAKHEREITNTVLLAEVDMLYEIFMSAALPQYLKDSVGEKTALMKAKLAGEGKADEEN